MEIVERVEIGPKEMKAMIREHPPVAEIRALAKTDREALIEFCMRSEDRFLRLWGEVLAEEP